MSVLNFLFLSSIKSMPSSSLSLIFKLKDVLFNGNTKLYLFYKNIVNFNRICWFCNHDNCYQVAKIFFEMEHYTDSETIYFGVKVR